HEQCGPGFWAVGRPPRLLYAADYRRPGGASACHHRRRLSDPHEEPGSSARARPRAGGPARRRGALLALDHRLRLAESDPRRLRAFGPHLQDRSALERARLLPGGVLPALRHGAAAGSEGHRRVHGDLPRQPGPVRPRRPRPDPGAAMTRLLLAALLVAAPAAA